MKRPGQSISSAAASPSTWARVRSASGETPPMARYRRRGRPAARARAAAAADPRVEGLDLLGRAGGAVRHDEHPDGGTHGLAATPARPSAWTRSTSAARMPGSVSGSTPWPRLKMCPGSVPARSRTSRASVATASKGARQTAGSRLPCTARSGPTRRPGVVERDPPVDADDVGAGRAP